MKTTIISISDSDKHFSYAIDEYVKRFGNNLKIINIKPIKNGTIKQIIEKETEKILEHIIKTRGFKILLSISGNKSDTIQFKNFIEKKTEIVFIIGGPYGLNESRLTNFIDHKLSLSDMTLPHGLAKLFILEQIYRVQSIIENRSYHY